MATPEVRAEMDRLASQEWLDAPVSSYNETWQRQRSGKWRRSWDQITTEVNRTMDEALGRVDKQVAADRMATSKGRVTLLRNIDKENIHLFELGKLLAAFDLEIEIRPRRTP